MNVRTRETTVTFDHPFQLSATDGALPAGTYRVGIDEAPLPGLSLVAYRRVATLLHTPALAAPQGRSACLPVDAAELDAALLWDRQQSAVSREATPAIPAVPATRMDAPSTANADVAPASQRQPRP